MDLYSTKRKKNNHIRHKTVFSLITVYLLAALLLSSCSDSGNSSLASDSRPNSKNTKSSSSKSSEPLRDNTPKVLTPEASGTAVYGNDFAAIDASNAGEGYFMVQYNGSNEKVKLKVAGPSDSEYIYLLSARGEYETFPFPRGSGKYQIQVFENVSGDSYAVVSSAEVEVTIADEFKPFLYPNQYVNFKADSKVVAKASELVAKAHSDLDAVTEIYHYVTENITYDEKKAESVVYGYLPVVDETLAEGKGICFDYASVMGAMLRSQGIPTKLEVGYSGEAYHAWISTYLDEIGWVDGIIEFDGSNWSLIDPTLAANNSKSSVGKYIGDGSNYILKYSY
ncbi:MAG: transglutaminase domain-containing protein [Coprococcus sp.]|nr:transglutaminase domain-containing protein [Coprococcus sp.]